MVYIIIIIENLNEIMKEFENYNIFGPIFEFQIKIKKNVSFMG